jgi:hypothetical protein
MFTLARPTLRTLHDLQFPFVDFLKSIRFYEARHASHSGKINYSAITQDFIESLFDPQSASRRSPHFGSFFYAFAFSRTADDLFAPHNSFFISLFRAFFIAFNCFFVVPFSNAKRSLFNAFQ